MKLNPLTSVLAALMFAGYLVLLGGLVWGFVAWLVG